VPRDGMLPADEKHTLVMRCRIRYCTGK
jgi:hypothetical protein